MLLTSSTTVVSILLAIIFSWLINNKNKPNSKIYPFSVFLVLSISSLVSYLLKLGFSRTRPFILSDEIMQLTTVNTFSFPSGHTTAVCSIVFGLLFFYPKKRLLIPVIFWAVLVMYSRLVFGVHFLSDLFGGAALSFFVALSLHFWLKNKIENSEKIRLIMYLFISTFFLLL